MPVNDVEDLVLLYMTERGISRTLAIRKVHDEVDRMEVKYFMRLSLSPPSPARVVAQVAEVLPPLPLAPALGARFAKVTPQGFLKPWVQLPLGLHPVNFDRGYWLRETPDAVELYQGGGFLDKSYRNAPSGTRGAVQSILVRAREYQKLDEQHGIVPQ